MVQQITEPGLIYEQLVEHAPDGILFADRQGNIRLWNAGAEAIFGYRAEEAIGESLDLIVPEKLRQRHWEGYHKVVASGETRYGSELLKVPATHKDGKRLSIEFTVMLIRDRANELLGVGAVIRDVTERWQQEKELKERLKFLEGQVESE